MTVEVAEKHDRHREIVIGNRVEVSGLVNNPDLNGRFGTVDAQPIFYINKFVSLVELTALYLIADVSAPFRSLVWRLLTEIPLCHGCSCQEIFRVETAHQVGRPARPGAPLPPHSHARQSVLTLIDYMPPACGAPRRMDD